MPEKKDPVEKEEKKKAEEAPIEEQESGEPEPLPEAPVTKDVTKEATTWGMIAHLIALAGYVIPFGGIIGPLVIWLVKKDDHPFIADQGKESLNFQITLAIAELLCIPLFFVCIGVPLIILLALANLIFIIVAAIAAADGKYYRYPWALRLVK